VSDASAIGADVWAVVGTCPIGASAPAPSCAVVVEQSADTGATWSQSSTPPPVHESAGLSIGDQDVELARITAARAYVLSFVSQVPTPGANTGQLVYTADGGDTWQPRADPCPSYFQFGEQLAASGTNDLWLLCASQASGGSQAKALFRSADGGATWELAAAANDSVLSGNVTLPAVAGVPAGTPATTGKPTTTGTPATTGSPTTTGTPPATPVGTLPVSGYVAPYSLGHDNLAVLSPDEAWLFPDRAGVYATENGGQTWELVAGLAAAGEVEGGTGNVVFVDATHGWVCETGAGLWRTTDGVTWKRLGPAGQ
jgi:photosystem II stability/assembly factor-like uncharacterized protein